MTTYAVINDPPRIVRHSDKDKHRRDEEQISVIAVDFLRRLLDGGDPAIRAMMAKEDTADRLREREIDLFAEGAGMVLDGLLDRGAHPDAARDLWQIEAAVLQTLGIAIAPDMWSWETAPENRRAACHKAILILSRNWAMEGRAALNEWIDDQRRDREIDRSIQDGHSPEDGGIASHDNDLLASLAEDRERQIAINEQKAEQSDTHLTRAEVAEAQALTLARKLDEGCDLRDILYEELQETKTTLANVRGKLSLVGIELVSTREERDAAQRHHAEQLATIQRMTDTIRRLEEGCANRDDRIVTLQQGYDRLGQETRTFRGKEPEGYPGGEFGAVLRLAADRHHGLTEAPTGHLAEIGAEVKAIGQGVRTGWDNGTTDRIALAIARLAHVHVLRGTPLLVEPIATAENGEPIEDDDNRDEAPASHEDPSMETAGNQLAEEIAAATPLTPADE